VASYKHWFWIGLSGIVGLGISDLSLIASFMMIGPRRSALITSLSPISASIGSYLILEETITLSAAIGMATTLIGIIVVILEKEQTPRRSQHSKKVFSQGVFFAFVGAIGQGVALTLAKKGMYLNSEVTIDPLFAAFIRVISGAMFMWVWAVVMGKLSELRKALKNRAGIKYTSVSAFMGPFLGVTLALVAVTYTQIGIALTLMNLSPIIIIPVLWMFYREKSSWRAVLGAVVAVIGVAILFIT
jgi:drug/metabolite transporter (DMT)-like permease